MDMPIGTPRPRKSLLSALAPIALAIALAPTVFAAPAFAQSPHGGGGGGHGSFGGGHASGGHMGAAVVAPHFAARPSYGAGTSYAAHPSYAPSGGYRGYATRANATFAAPVRVGSYVNNAPVARGNFAVGGARYTPGRYGPGAGYSYGHWNGGYWRGGFWPRVYGGANYAWFLPVLPAYCATYWWNSVPYYYYNDVYYTYDPSASGYVVTTPPPAQDTNNPQAPAPADATSDDAAASGSPPQGAPAGSANSAGLFAYPKNGQSDEQQSADKQQCASWASGQMNADGTGTSMDYQRAMTACLQGRGYSVD